MAKSARASTIKKNKASLKKRVFGPVEAARNERLQAKLQAIIDQPKPLRSEMEVENDSTAKETEAKEDEQIADDTMDVDTSAKSKRGNNFLLERNAKQKKAKAARVEKSSRHRKAKNSIVFAKTGRAKAVKRSR